MTIDEFLTSNEISHEFNEEYVLKIKYNDNIDYIFKTNYGILNFDKNLECVGLFNKSNNKLYGSSFEFNNIYKRELFSEFYIGSIEKIKRDLYKNADKMLNDYIKQNAENLRKEGKKSFDEYILNKENYASIKGNAIKKYIYNSKSNDIEFNINQSKYEISNDIYELIMKTLENQAEMEQKVFDEYINNSEKTEKLYSSVSGISDIEVTVKEKIGAKLLEKDLEDEFILKLENNPINEYKIKHDIIKAIKDIDAQMLTINLCHNENEITFKYPKYQLYNFWLSDYYIPEVSKREELKEIYKGERNYDDFQLEDIKSIRFRKQILYENKKEIELNNEKYELDIIDEMFE